MLTAHFCPAPSEIVQRYKFHCLFRQQRQSVAAFVAELRAGAEFCNFGTSLEEMIRDKLVCGISDEQIQRRLLSENKLTLNKALELAQSMELAKKSTEVLSTAKSEIEAGAEDGGVHAVTAARSKPGNLQCSCCGKRGHVQEKCRFKDYKCHTCGAQGHLQKMCRDRKAKKIEIPSTAVSCVQQDSEQQSEFYIQQLSSHKPLVVSVVVDGANIDMEVDTGAGVSLVSETTFRRLWPHKTWKSSSVQLRNHSGELVPVWGAVDVEVLFKGRKWSLELLVVKGNGASLMGRSWLLFIPGILEKVNTMVGDSLDEVIKKHSPLFTEKLGTLSGYKAKIQVDPMAVPRFKARSIPYSIKVKVEEELTRLVAEGILEPVTFSDWAAPIVAIRKSDKQSVRICGDYKMSVNPVSKLDRYPIPRVEDLFATLSGGESFSKIDLSQAYNQVLLDEDSKQYTVINTHKGLFRYNRLPFGINSAPGIFQRVMEGLLQGMDGVIVYIDDILVTGKTRTEHIKTLDEVLARLGKAGLHLNKNKCVFLAPSVSYLGFCIDSQGLHP